ncbi:hypothetical protein TrVE_jg6342 [Triparma verrucosa]|uniref:ACT domain-containing protein n=1 Tax=Triparma verrucosa TaxID=1606542 RepID=A0A9W7F0N5_9STRA|nr:hypothetical protein TrVE_jg6342 [Triparma verrucosa]
MASWTTIKSIPKVYPLAFGVVFSTFKTSFSDLLVQKTVEKRENIDWRRNAAFATFGCFYLGGVQYGLYVKLFRKWFPTSTTFPGKTLAQKAKDKVGMKETGYQVFIDQFVHHPFSYFPVFYATKEIVQHGADADIKRAVFTDYFGTNMKEDVIALWKVWLPSTVLNFAFMPMWGRIPWVASTSLIWTCILSMMRGGNDQVVMDENEIIGPHVSGKTMKIYSGEYSPRLCPIELDPHLSHVVVSASGKDKGGIVSRMAASVAAAGGNLTTSKMHRLGDQFIILMHVSYDKEKVRHLDLLQSIRNTSEDLVIKINTIQPRKTNVREKAPEVLFNLHSIGPDRKGVVAQYAEAFHKHDINIEHLSSDLKVVNGERVFVVDIDGSDFNGRANIEEFKDKLETIKKDLEVKTAKLKVSNKDPSAE